MSRRTDHLTALRQAHHAYEHQDTSDRQARFDSVVQLAEWKLFSNNQIQHFTGMGAKYIRAVTGKTDRTGGRLPGAALKPIIDSITALERGDDPRESLRAAFDAGASSRMIARLVDLSESTMRRRAA